MSDTHIEMLFHQTRIASKIPAPLCLFTGFQELLDMKPDILLLAGDIGSAMGPDGKRTMMCARLLHDQLGCPVVVVPGNHEYYGHEFHEALSVMRAEAVPGRVWVLDRDDLTISMHGQNIRILGATMWTDYNCTRNPVVTMMACARGMNDHNHIRIRDAAGIRLLTPQDLLDEHRKSRAWMMERLTTETDATTIIVTHHVPHTAFRHPRFPVEDRSAGFMSDLDDLIYAASDAGVVAWIFGHHHVSMQREAMGIHFLSEQVGYIGHGEKTGWRGPGLFLLDGKKIEVQSKENKP
jgi:predicted phosphohydrolase